jgi:hypothetical protein
MCSEYWDTGEGANACFVYRESQIKLFCFAGVRELFEQEPPPPPRKTRAELMKDIDADYYGYRDDDDGILTPLEQNEERRGDTEVYGYRHSQTHAIVTFWKVQHKSHFVPAGIEHTYGHTQGCLVEIQTPAY